jgi:formate C-acetyltransferase
MDRYLYPYYAADLARGILDRKGAKEILSCFSIKMSEIVPVFSELLTNFHGGMFNGQVVTVGGLDRAGNDSTNELSLVFLEIMDELRMRQPNYHARLHPGSPTEYVEKIMETLARGSASPALYNDLAIIKAMTARGYSIEDARDYTAVGCVEPVSQGKSFSSTDAAIFNAPICLEMALNGGRRFHRLRHSGARSPMPSTWKTMEDAKAAFEAQLRHGLTRLARDARAIETANARYHPTPLTSSLIEGCLETGRCSTKGGATYNFSGLQCVGPVDAGDALYALERAFAKEGPPAFVALARDCAKNLADEKTRIRLKNAEKYGNDDEGADAWTRYVVDAYVAILESLGPNTRGGPYVAGLYSVTAHEYFGRVTGALPNGRRRGEPFSSGISAENGMDRLGPTAMLNSAARIDYSRVANGVNLNLRFDPRPLSSKEGPAALRGLVKAFFDRGGMQVQANVIDTRTLIAARDDPSAYPNLLVRVSGYSSYFNDLTPAMKDEIIKRSEHRC